MATDDGDWTPLRSATVRHPIQALLRTTSVEDAPCGPRLGIAVGPDAVLCLDLVLDDVGVDYHHLRFRRGGASAVIELVDRVEGYRVVDALRQHLGAELHEATIYEDDCRIRVVWQPPVAKLASLSVEPWRSPAR